MKKAFIHQTPEERLANSSNETVSAVNRGTEEVTKVGQAINNLHATVQDKSVEAEGFNRVAESTDGVGEKVEEVRNATEQSNKHLASIEENTKKPPIHRIGMDIEGAEMVTIKGKKGDDGKDGERGSKFLGHFSSEDQLPPIENLQKGDFAIVGVQGTLWYIV